jgi:hypothetical protein
LGFSLCFILFSLIIGAGSYFRANFYREFRKFIYNDCKMFDKSIHNLNDYFTKDPKQGLQNNFYDTYNYNNFNDELFFNEHAFRSMRSAFSDMNVNALDIRVHDNHLKTNTINTNEDLNIMKLNDNKFMDNNSDVLQNNYIQNSAEIDKQFNQHDIISTEMNPYLRLNLYTPEHITLKDLSSLTEDEKLKFDRRTCCQYFKDTLVSHHTLFSLMKYSILDLSCVRSAKFVFMINQIIGFNAILYFDDYIEKNRELNIVKYFYKL